MYQMTAAPIATMTTRPARPLTKNDIEKLKLRAMARTAVSFAFIGMPRPA